MATAVRLSLSLLASDSEAGELYVALPIQSMALLTLQLHTEAWNASGDYYIMENTRSNRFICPRRSARVLHPMLRRGCEELPVVCMVDDVSPIGTLACLRELNRMTVPL